jgi:hypothetical protein
MATSTRSRPRRATKAQITEDDIYVFSNGACHVLAREISALTSWPIHCFLDWNEEAEKHAFVVPLPGWRLDVRGLSLAYDHDKLWSWEPFSHSSFPYEHIVECWGARRGDWVAEQEAHARRAREIAPLLIAAFAGDQRIASGDKTSARRALTSCRKGRKRSRNS